MTKGRYGRHGGQYIPETLMNAVIELEAAYEHYKNDPEFNTELTKLFKRLYEDSVLGRIPDEQYRILSQEYTAEQKENQEQLPAMEARLQELKDSSSNIARFIENAKRYKEIPELTAEILRIFIKRVEVGERAEKYSRTAPQEVRIYYRDIGLVDELPQRMADSVAEAIQNEVA